MAENLAGKVVEAFLKSQDIRTERLEEDVSVLRVGFSMNNKESIRIIMFFSEDCSDIKFRAFNLAKFPEEKKDAMYKVCNDLNIHFRWIKFFVEEDDNTITAEDDAVIQLDSCGQEAMRCILQLARISDDAYPIIMKAIYS